MKRIGKKAKRGFTLIETVIAIAVFSIFSAGAVGILVPVFNIYTSAIKLSDARLMAFNVLDMVENELEYLKPDQQAVIAGDGATITFSGNYGQTGITSAAPGGEGYLYMSRGGAALAYTPYYDPSYYKNKTISLLFANTEGSAVYQVTVKVFGRDGAELCRADGQITPLAAVTAG